MSFRFLGLVVFRFLPANAKGSTGNTLGCSAQAENVKVKKDGTFAGSLLPQLDREFGISLRIPIRQCLKPRLTFGGNSTIDWQTRQHQVDFVLNLITLPLHSLRMQMTLSLTYKSNCPTRGLASPPTPLTPR